MLYDTIAGGKAHPYLLTLTFDRYDDRYIVGGGCRIAPSRAEVLGGLTRKMPPSAALDRRQADIRRFYVRLCRPLLGRDWSATGDLQPRGIGWLDRPAYKGAKNRSPLTRRPGDVFQHAHIVLTVPTLTPLGRDTSINRRFEKLYADGTLGLIWRNFHTEGEVHIEPSWDPRGALDYSAKSAKRDGSFEDDMIILPAR